jgi:thymidylate kinase
MIVYIEGVDGSGKSTFAKAITTYLQEKGFAVYPKAEKLMVTHPWREDRTTKEELTIQLRSCLASNMVHIVDRGELSDIIYRTFDSHKYQSLMSLYEYHLIFRAYSHRYIIIHCDSEMSEQLMLTRGEDNHISIVEHQKLRYLFNQIMPLFRARKFDAAKSIADPDYLPNMCHTIRMDLLSMGATDHDN